MGGAWGFLHSDFGLSHWRALVRPALNFNAVEPNTGLGPKLYCRRGAWRIFALEGPPNGDLLNRELLETSIPEVANVGENLPHKRLFADRSLAATAP